MTEKTTDSANLSEFDPERRAKPAVNEDESRDEAMLYEQGVETRVDGDPIRAARQRQAHGPNSVRPEEAPDPREIPSGDMNETVDRSEQYARKPDTGDRVKTS